MKQEYLECGKIVAPHGVQGVMKVESWCDTPKVLASAKKVYLKNGEQYRESAVVTASVNGEGVLMRLDGVPTREAAQALKNTVIYLHRSDIPIPKGSMLIADMIGLPVVDIDSKKVYGTLKEVSDGVKNRIYTISTEGKDVLLPAVAEFVKEVSEENGILVRPIPGFFEE